MKTPILSTLALLAVAGSALAAPSEMPPPPSASVAYADLDLKDPKDAAAMLKRIRKASASLCSEGSGFVGNDPETIRRIDGCFRQSVGRAVAGLNAPLVTQAYGARPAGPVLARLP